MTIRDTAFRDEDPGCRERHLSAQTDPTDWLRKTRMLGARHALESAKRARMLLVADILGRVVPLVICFYLIADGRLGAWSLLFAAIAGVLATGLSSSVFHDAIHRNFPWGRMVNDLIALTTAGALGVSPLPSSATLRVTATSSSGVSAE